jgi:hypothetical protein
MSAEERNYYEILGLPATASLDQIRTAYRRLAFQFHPDRNSDPAAQNYFQKIIEAFSVLSDPENRREYDAILFSDLLVIESAISSSVLSAGELYDSVAGQVGNERVSSDREKYLQHVRKSNRRRTVAQTVISIIVILLLIFYGFKPLRASSGSIAPTETAAGTTDGSSMNSRASSGSSLNQNLVVIIGATGAQGVAGPAGRDGRIGIDGIPGPAGANGADGAQGPAGANGKDGAVGPAGPAGPTGAPGANGSSGSAGSQGPAGAQGPAGVAGAKGDQGLQGPAGQDATVYTVKPNIGAVSGYIGPCNQDLSDTSTAPGLDVSITPLFDATDGTYRLKSFNFKGFTPPCRGAQLGINIVLAANATAHPNATFQCVKLIPNSVIPTDIVKFESGITSECTKYSGWGGANGDPLDIGIIVASDLARINLIVSG